MLKRLSEWMQDFSTGKMTLFALFIFILFLIIVVPKQAAVAREYSARVGTPDLSLYYSAEKLYAIAEAYGEEGRAAFIRARLTFDLIWPLVFTFSLFTALSILSKEIFSPNSPWRMVNLIPFFGAGFDYLENISNVIVMARYPEKTEFLANFSGVATFLKWISVGSATILMIVFLLIAIWYYFTTRGK